MLLPETEPLPEPLPDPVEAAASFAVSQPGWVERVASRHTRGDRGLCAGCGVERPAQWPCVLVYIARRAMQIDRDQGLAWRTPQMVATGQSGPRLAQWPEQRPRESLDLVPRVAGFGT